MSCLVSLTRKHRMFVEAFEGDPLNACLAAGWQGAPNYLKAKGEELLRNPIIIEAIKDRSRYQAKSLNLVADREERQAFFTAIMRNKEPDRNQEIDANGIPISEENYNVPLPHRLKAAELLGKSEGDFIDRVSMDVNMSMSDMVMKSYGVEESVEAIEAEYWERKGVTPAIEAPTEAPTSLEDFL